jgi:tetratricopeptide (TPR) repeat protein
MVSLRTLGCFAASAIATTSLWAASKGDTPVFDKGEKDDFQKGVVYKERKETTKKGGKDTKTVKAVAYHVKNLKDPDPEVRQSSCEMLGILLAATAVPDLIDVLRPGREDKIMVLLSANGALVRITQKNFGYKNYDEWNNWWLKEGKEFLAKAETGPDEKQKLKSLSANTLGLELLHRGQHQQAEQQFLEAVNGDPTVPDYKNNLGLAVMGQARFLDAMEYFKEVMGMNPDLPQPYMNIGRCYSAMGKGIEALHWFKKAMDMDKEGKLWEPFWMLGREYMRRGEWSTSWEYVDSARTKMEKNNLHDPRVYKDLAIIHYGLDQYHSAWKEIKNVETLGFDCDAGFVKKVRKALQEQGVDPDAEDKSARQELLGVKVDKEGRREK